MHSPGLQTKVRTGFERQKKNDHRAPVATVSSEVSSPLVVQDHAQQGVVYVEPAIVIDEP
jgi:hypothetical protein